MHVVSISAAGTYPVYTNGVTYPAPKYLIIYQFRGPNALEAMVPLTDEQVTVMDNQDLPNVEPYIEPVGFYISATTSAPLSPQMPPTAPTIMHGCAIKLGWGEGCLPVIFVMVMMRSVF